MYAQLPSDVSRLDAIVVPVDDGNTFYVNRHVSHAAKQSLKESTYFIQNKLTRAGSRWHFNYALPPVGRRLGLTKDPLPLGIIAIAGIYARRCCHR